MRTPVQIWHLPPVLSHLTFGKVSGLSRHASSVRIRHATPVFCISIAQLAEHWSPKPEVEGSMPSRDAIFRGFAKWPTASRFDRDIRTFETSTLCHSFSGSPPVAMEIGTPNGSRRRASASSNLAWGTIFAGLAEWLRRQPSKLCIWVRFPWPAPPFHMRVAQWPGVRLQPEIGWFDSSRAFQ